MLKIPFVLEFTNPNVLFDLFYFNFDKNFSFEMKTITLQTALFSGFLFSLCFYSRRIMGCPLSLTTPHTAVPSRAHKSRWQ